MNWSDFERSLFGKASRPTTETPSAQPASRGLSIIPNTVVQLRKFSARFAARLGLTSGQQGLDGYIADLLTAISVNRFNPEDYYPDELLACGTLSPGAVALNFSRVALVNPVGSGVIAVVTRIAGSLGAVAGPIQVGTDASNSATFAALTLTVRGSVRDGRFGNVPFTGVGPAQCFLHSDNNTATAFPNGPILTRNAAVQSEAEWGNQDDAIIILAPGQAVITTPQAVNTALTCEYWWRERPFNS